MGTACLCKMQFPAPALPTVSEDPASMAEPAQAPAMPPSTDLPKSKVSEQRKGEETDRKGKEGAKKAKEDNKRAKDEAKKGEDSGEQSYGGSEQGYRPAAVLRQHSPLYLKSVDSKDVTATILILSIPRYSGKLKLLLLKI